MGWDVKNIQIVFPVLSRIAHGHLTKAILLKELKMCNHVWEVKTDYLTGVATQSCRICGEVKQVPGTFMSVLDGIKEKKLHYRERIKEDYSGNYLAQGTQWKVRGKIERK